MPFIGEQLRDLIDNGGAGGGISFVQPTISDGGSTYNPTKWSVADVNGVTIPTDGMTIAVRTPNGGGSYGVMLSIDGGNNYYPIVRNKDTRVFKQYPQNATLILTFNAIQTVSVYSGSSTQTTVTGCWQIADYDNDNNVTQAHTTTDSKYPLLFQYRAGATLTTTTTDATRFTNKIYANPSKGAIYAYDVICSGRSFVYLYDNYPFSVEREYYDIVSGDQYDIEVYATDGMPLFIEIYVCQFIGIDQAPTLHLYNQNAGDYIDIPYTYGNEYSIIIKPNGSNFDFYIRNLDGVISYLGTMSMEYIYLTSPTQAWSYETEIVVKYCWLNTMV